MNMIEHDDKPLDYPTFRIFQTHPHVASHTFPGLLEPCSFPQAVAEAVYQVVDDAEVGAGGILRWSQ